MKVLEEKEVGTFEAKNKLSALLDEAAQGRRIWITKRGKRVALLSSGITESTQAKSSLTANFKKIRSRSKPGPESIKSMIEEGRH